MKAGGIYPDAYYPHNVHFVLVSAQMAGDAATVLAAAEKLDKIVPEDAARTVPLAQPVKAAPLFAYAQFATPEKILALPSPADDLPYLKGLWHYARGVALAAKGDVAAAQGEADAIGNAAKDTRLETLKTYGIPGAQVLELAQHIVLARMAQAGGDLKKAIGEFETAAELEGSLPYMEPAYWDHPGEAVARRSPAARRRDGSGRSGVQGEPRQPCPTMDGRASGCSKLRNGAAMPQPSPLRKSGLGRTWVATPRCLI